MMIRLSASSFAGTARTLVAVGISSEACMLLTTRAGAPRSTEACSPATGATAGSVQDGRALPSGPPAGADPAGVVWAGAGPAGVVWAGAGPVDAEPSWAGAEPTWAGAEPSWAGAEPSWAGAEPSWAGAEPVSASAGEL